MTDNEDIKQEITDYDHLVYRVLSTDDGRILMKHWKRMLMEARFYPGEDPMMGIYREGGQQMLRHIIECHDLVKNFS